MIFIDPPPVAHITFMMRIVAANRSVNAYLTPSRSSVINGERFAFDAIRSAVSSSRVASSGISQTVYAEATNESALMMNAAL